MKIWPRFLTAREMTIGSTRNGTAMKNTMDIRHTDGIDGDFVMLCGELDRYLTEVDGADVMQGKYNPFNSLEDVHDAFVVYQDGVPVGCVSFKRYDGDTAEVKRMFVRDGCRGGGASKLLMAALERKAVEKGFSTLILETGKHLKAAIGLYQKAGFVLIPNFGRYKEMSNSICMRKEIHPSRQPSPAEPGTHRTQII